MSRPRQSRGRCGYTTTNKPRGVIAINKSKLQNIAAKQKAIYDGMAREELEPGVTRMNPPKDQYGNQHGSVLLYRLDDMNDEAIARYGLTSVYKQYKARHSDD